MDCTSNQAIAFNKLTKLTPDGKLYHEQLIRDAAKDAQSWAKETWSDIDPVLLAVEIMVFNQEPDEDSPSGSLTRSDGQTVAAVCPLFDGLLPCSDQHTLLLLG